MNTLINDDRGTSSPSRPFELPASNQRLLGPPHPANTVLPLALRPSPSTPKPTLEAVLTTIHTLQKEHHLTKHLSCHGALLFRNLPIHNAEDFSAFAQAFNFAPHEIIGIVVDRPVLAPNSLTHQNTSFSTGTAPPPPEGSGGETPLSSSLELFRRAQREIPSFIDNIAEKGILSRAFGKEWVAGDDEATKRRKVEAQIRRYGRGEHTTWEWLQDGSGRMKLVLEHRLPAIRTQPGRNLPALFTGLAAYWKRVQVADARGKGTRQLFGDGSPIPEEDLEALASITGEIRVLHRWVECDVLVIDNLVAQHGREPWRGEQADRIVLASLFDGPVVPGAYGFGDWAQVVQAAD
ncbi:Clavaminate synthase-like protein [Aspergillus homomorphus CBS 101889]|uniref:Clavaminate synthase-like protein n=1 Tax=Aspergillus homomorphus (strain CBS 101889) TaxID=1450537 RepID=A0A395HY30_ASPHC|nr:Clavaminate synthase-like protein [Aspergillus homomorphus CBS 101889]RAL12409.1 Clavaminate synthase-like protein [Aspergillus homomorphus CBS 101889]